MKAFEMVEDDKITEQLLRHFHWTLTAASCVVRSPGLPHQGTALHPLDESQGLSRSVCCKPKRSMNQWRACPLFTARGGSYLYSPFLLIQAHVASTCWLLQKCKYLLSSLFRVWTEPIVDGSPNALALNNDAWQPGEFLFGKVEQVFPRSNVSQRL
jgi:hypothetical protein